MRRLGLLLAFAVVGYTFHKFVSWSEISSGHFPDDSNPTTPKPNTKDLEHIILSALPDRLPIPGARFVLLFFRAASKRPPAEALRPLTELLDREPSLSSISIGFSRLNRSLCGIRQSGWTVALEASPAQEGPEACLRCSVISDMVLVKRSWLQSRWDIVRWLKGSSQLFLSLSLDRGNAYCPDDKMTTHMLPTVLPSHYADVPFHFDGHFVRYAEIGLWRLQTASGASLWLGCVWTASSVGLPVDCARWLGVYLGDIQSFWQRGLAGPWADFAARLVHGTLLGAVRKGSLIPWTLDVDLLLWPTTASLENRTRWHEEETRFKRLAQRVGEMTNGLYSHTSVFGAPSNVIRFFRSAPVQFAQENTSNFEREQEQKISREISRAERGLACSSARVFGVPGAEAAWMSAGYVDVYRLHEVERVLPRRCRRWANETTRVLVDGRRYAAWGPAEAFLACRYGPTWHRPPQGALEGDRSCVLETSGYTLYA